MDRLAASMERSYAGSTLALSRRAPRVAARGRLSARSQAVAMAPPSMGAPPMLPKKRNLRLGIPSKGRMAELTLELLNDCQLTVRKLNDRQYIAKMPNVDNLEVWFQRASDVMRKMRAGDIDVGIVGFDMFTELGEGDPDLIVVHDSLNFGQCHLAVAVPQGWENVNSIQDLKALGWTAQRPMRVVTGYTHVAKEFFKRNGIEHVQLSTADGALEAAPAMGSADVILDLVSSGTTLRENNLKQIEGGRVLESQGVLVASRSALLEREGALDVIRDMIERLDAHLRAEGQFTVTANMRGKSAEDVATKLHNAGPLLQGLQGPTIGSVYTWNEGKPQEGHYYSASLVVPRKKIYDAVKMMRSVGGSGVLVSPVTYIFDEEPPRWRALLETLGLDPAKVPQ